LETANSTGILNGLRCWQVFKWDTGEDFQPISKFAQPPGLDFISHFTQNGQTPYPEHIDLDQA
jgi:hypothetical protein